MRGARKLSTQLGVYFAEVDARREPGTLEEDEDIITETEKRPSGLSSAYLRLVGDPVIVGRANAHSRGLARKLLLRIIYRKRSMMISNEILHDRAIGVAVLDDLVLMQRLRL